MRSLLEKTKHRKDVWTEVRKKIQEDEHAFAKRVRDRELLLKKRLHEMEQPPSLVRRFLLLPALAVLPIPATVHF